MSLTLLTGCGSYWTARGRDLSDSVRLGMGIGGGLYLEAEATSLVHPSIGFGDVSLRPRYAVEWEPRPVPPGRLRTAAFPTLLVAWPFHGASEVEEGYGDTHPYWRGLLAPFALVGNQHVAKETTGLLGLGRWLGNPRFEEERTWEANQQAKEHDDSEEAAATELRPRHRGSGLPEHTWIGASGTAGFVQFDAGFNPLEFVDFLTGWFGWDLLGDDSRNR